MSGDVTRHPANLTRSGRRHRGLDEQGIRRPADAPALTFAIADPPYPGQSARHYGDHEDFGGEVDHEHLVRRLMDEYPDGWVLCSGSIVIPEIAAMLPSGTRTLAWVKPMQSLKPGVSVDFGWEPVYLWGGRRRPRTAPMVRDWLACSPERHAVSSNPNAVIGMKPAAVCRWLFECLGARPDMGDQIVDLFPGSGAVTKAWDRWAPQLRIENDVDQLELEA